MLLIVPSFVVNIFCTIPYTTTHEMKCGRYNTDWVNFLKRKFRSSFNISAIIMVSGKLITMVAKLRKIVFRIAVQKFVFANIFLNTSRPINSLPKTPLKTL